MIDLVTLKKNLQKCYQDLDIHEKALERYIHEASSLKVNIFCLEEGEEIQYNYNSNLKPKFTLLKDSLKLLFSLCLKIKLPASKTVDINTLTEHIKSLFINYDQKLYLLELIEEGDHELKRHSRYCQELRILSKKIETKIDTIKLLNYFIDERYVVNPSIQTNPLRDSYNLINNIFDEYYVWENPLEGISELGNFHYYHKSRSKKKKILKNDDEIWSELIKSTFGEKKCDPFLDLYMQIQTKIKQDNSKVPDLKRRRINHV